MKFQFCFTLFLMTACSAASADDAINFKGIPMLIALEKFKLLAHPDGTKDAHVICSNDNGPEAEELTAIEMSEAERMLGVVKCAFYGKLVPGDLTDSVSPLSMGGGQYVSWSYTFSFYAEKAGGKMRLYSIILPTNTKACSDVTEALVSKFGRSNKNLQGNVQNMMGSKFSQKTLMWSKSGSGVVVMSPWAKVGTMAVIYTNDKISSSVVAAERNLKTQKTNKM